MTQSNRLTPVSSMTLAAFGVGFFLLGCVMNLLGPRWVGPSSAAQLADSFWLRLTTAALDSLLLVTFVQVSLILGWRKTLLFWLTILAYTLAGWLAVYLIPLLAGGGADGTSVI